MYYYHLLDLIVRDLDETIGPIIHFPIMVVDPISH